MRKYMEPCPFCGAKEVDGEEGVYVCRKCGASAPKAAWNIRVGGPVLCKDCIYITKSHQCRKHEEEGLLPVKSPRDFCSKGKRTGGTK